MLLRRIRGVFTAAVVWGGLSALGVGVGGAIVVLAEGGSIRAAWSALLQAVPYFFAYGAALGGMIALVVTIAERNGSVDALTSRRFELWGLVAGALLGLGIEARSPHTSLESIAIMVLLCSYAGASSARTMLRLARRAREKVSV